MFEWLKNLIASLRKGKDIRSRLLRLVLSGGLLIATILAAFSLSGMAISLWFLETQGRELRSSTAGFVERFTERHAREDLLERTVLKAKVMDTEFQKAMESVRMMSDVMTDTMRSPGKHAGRELPNARTDAVSTRSAYVYYSSDLISRGITPEVQRDVWIVSDFADTAEALGRYYTCVFVADRRGFLLRVDAPVNDTGEAALSKEPARSSYEPRNRRWYQVGKSATTPTFTDIYYYTGTDEPCISCAMPYYDNSGFAGVVGLDQSIDEIYHVMNEARVQESGFSFILDNHGNILYSTLEATSEAESDFAAGRKELQKDSDPVVVELARAMMSGEKDVLLSRFDGEDMFLAFAPIETVGWSLATVVTKEEVIAPAVDVRSRVSDLIYGFKEKYENLFEGMMALMVILLAVVVVLIFKKSINMSDKFVKPIQELAGGVKEITSGNFDKQINVKGSDEIEHLAICFNAMTAELKTYMDNLTKATAERERIATELDVAKNIQTSMLPNDFNLNRDDVSLYATMEAAKAVGGDFYDFYFLDTNHLVVTIADVSGKGVPAALFMMRSKTILKNLTLTMSNPDDLAAVVTLTNDQLCQNNDADMFVTVFTGILNLKTGDFTFVNGGHNPPLIYRADANAWQYLNPKKSFIVGSMEGIHYKQQSITLSRGDALYLYTDGVTEAFDSHNAQYGEGRLLNTLNAMTGGLSAEEIIKTVRRDLKEHVQEAEQSDDITMLAVKLCENSLIDWFVCTFDWPKVPKATAFLLES